MTGERKMTAERHGATPMARAARTMRSHNARARRMQVSDAGGWAAYGFATSFERAAARRQFRIATVVLASFCVTFVVILAR